VLLLLLLQGRQDLRVLGFLQHHPDTSPMFLHRAGTFDRKYDPAVDETKTLTHIVVQPSCEWDTQRAPFGPTVSVAEQSVVRADSCLYELHNITAALEACEVEVRPSQGVQDGLPVGGSQPPVLEVRAVPVRLRPCMQQFAPEFCDALLLSLPSARFSSLPPCCLPQVGEDMPLALVQQQADAAFALLRLAKKSESTLF
jgi:hypothetical protein